MDFLVLLAFGHGPDFPGEGAYHRPVARNVSGLGDWRKGMALGTNWMTETAKSCLMPVGSEAGWPIAQAGERLKSAL